MVYFIILQPIFTKKMTSYRNDHRQMQAITGNRGASQPVRPVPFDNMGAERKKAALPGASQQIAANRSQCVPGVRVGALWVRNVWARSPCQ